MADPERAAPLVAWSYLGDSTLPILQAVADRVRDATDGEISIDAEWPANRTSEDARAHAAEAARERRKTQLAATKVQMEGDRDLAYLMEHSLLPSALCLHALHRCDGDRQRALSS